MEGEINMPDRDKVDFDNGIDLAIDLGIDYLYEHQYPNGEFCAYRAPDEAMKEWCIPDSNVFCTSVIAECLLKLRDEAKTKLILTRVVGFLSYQMMQGGVWNFFTKYSQLFKYNPADVDTTSCSSAVLKALGISFPENKQFLLANTNKDGLFYTWFVLRIGSKLSSTYLKIVGRELKRPIHSIAYWLQFEAKRNDLDAVVNTNALYYLGLNTQTTKIATYLLDILKRETTESSDKWYKNSIIFYYFVSRNYPKIKELEPAKPLIIKNLINKKNRDGSFGQTELENAMSITTLLNLNYKSSELEQSINALIESQRKTGCWPRTLLFYGGPAKKIGWGSEELTTGFCLEALAMYQTRRKANAKD